jgi:DNA-binding transcriptional ArsR family regulator
MKHSILTYAHALSSPTRLHLLQSVGNDGLSVTEAAHLTGLSTSTTSFHLGVLLDAGLVSRKRKGRCSIYRWSDTRLSMQVEKVQPPSSSATP